MIAYYATAVLPARPRKSRDKAKVEAAVRIVERWLRGKLRHRRFYSLADLNAAIAELLTTLNKQRVLRYVGRTRRQLFAELDQPRLKPPPAEPYVPAEWRSRKVGLDYHVEVESHFYSVQYRHPSAQLDVRFWADVAGKSWLACALGHKACRDNHALLRVRVSKLFDELILAHANGSAGRRLKALGAVQVLILDV